MSSDDQTAGTDLYVVRERLRRLTDHLDLGGSEAFMLSELDFEGIERDMVVALRHQLAAVVVSVGVLADHLGLAELAEKEGAE